MYVLLAINLETMRCSGLLCTWHSGHSEYLLKMRRWSIAQRTRVMSKFCLPK